MEFQGKFVEAALKFESVEEEHLAQMVTFMIKMSQVCVCVFVHPSILLFQERALILGSFLSTHSVESTTPPQAQDNSHVRVERVYSAINEQLNSLSVEKLLNDFVDAKGTGKEKPSEPFITTPAIKDQG